MGLFYIYRLFDVAINDKFRLWPLNGVMRAAARMIDGVPRFGHITDYMQDVLHWLPVQQRIHYRISSIVWHCVLGLLIFLSSLS